MFSQAQKQAQQGNSNQYFFDTNKYSSDEEESEERGGRKRRGRGDGPPNKKFQQQITTENCWFCLANVNLEKHLVVSVGSSVYMAMPKGPLTDGKFCRNYE
jgi:hypothetical protein